MNFEIKELEIDEDFAVGLLNYCDQLSLNLDLEAITNTYKDKSRKYHNIEHINDINLNIYNDYKKGLIDEKMAYRLIVISYYHDIIYDGGSNDNEEKSAELFLKDTGINLEEEVISIYNSIIATKHHKPIGISSKLFNIYDMNIILSDFTKLKEYERGIRYEYNMFPIEEYVPARIKFIEECIISYPENKKNLVRLIDYINISYT